jgi:hypothetical protein
LHLLEVSTEARYDGFSGIRTSQRSLEITMSNLEDNRIELLRRIAEATERIEQQSRRPPAKKTRKIVLLGWIVAGVFSLMVIATRSHPTSDFGRDRQDLLAYAEHVKTELRGHGVSEAKSSETAARTVEAISRLMSSRRISAAEAIQEFKTKMEAITPEQIQAEAIKRHLINNR